jgi:4-oxalocrotonate tautomerase
LYLLGTAIFGHQYSIRKLNLYLKASMPYNVLKYEQEGQNMPTVIIEADEGRTVEQKRGLVKDITDAVCRNFKVPPDSVTIFIHEGKKENRGKAGKLAID